MNKLNDCDGEIYAVITGTRHSMTSQETMGGKFPERQFTGIQRNMNELSV